MDEDRRVESDGPVPKVVNQSHESRSCLMCSDGSMPSHISLPNPSRPMIESFFFGPMTSLKVWMACWATERRSLSASFWSRLYRSSGKFLMFKVAMQLPPNRLHHGAKMDGNARFSSSGIRGISCPASMARLLRLVPTAKMIWTAAVVSATLYTGGMAEAGTDPEREVSPASTCATDPELK